MRRLLLLRGADPDGDGEVVSAALETLFLAMPEEFQQHPVFRGADMVTVIRAA